MKLPFKKSTGKDAAQKEPKPPKTPKAPKPPKQPKAPKVRGRGIKTKPLRLRFPKTPLFIFLVGDDGAVLLYIKDRKVQHRDFVASAEPDNLKILAERFAEDKEAPVVMVVDTMDQTYMPQTLPPVTSLSVGKLIKRRLEREFPDDEIRGALQIGRESKGRKDWHYLIIALERTEGLNKWLDFLDTLPNWLSGIYLVPVETENVVRMLERNLHLGKEYKAPEWKLVISYNKVSGFRQVILRKGRLALTRVGQPIGEPTPEVLAGNIEQEAQNTIEYMKRMGYQPEDGLGLYVIAAEAINKMIEPERLRVTEAHRLTPHQVGESLGLVGATQAADQYGDVVLAAAIGGARKHVLKFITKSAQKLDLFFKIKVGQRIAISIFTGALISYVGSTMYDIKTIINEIDNLHTGRNAKQRELETLKENIAKAPEDIDKITDMVELYELLTKRASQPLSVIERLSKVLGDDIRVRGLSWEVQENAAAKNASTAPQRGPDGRPLKPEGGEEEYDDTVMLKLRIEFLKGTDEQQRFVKMAEAWRLKLKEALDAKEVRYLALPGVVKENESFEISLGQTNATAVNRFDGKPIEADVEIETHVKMPPEKPPGDVSKADANAQPAKAAP